MATRVYLSSSNFFSPKVQIKDSGGNVLNYSSKRVYLRMINFLMKEISLQYHGYNLNRIKLFRLAIQYQTSLTIRNFRLGLAELLWVHCLELDSEKEISLPINISNSLNKAGIWVSRTGVMSGMFSNNLSSEIEWNRLRKSFEIEYFVWKISSGWNKVDRFTHPEITSPHFLEDTTPEGTRKYKRVFNCWVVSGQFAFERTGVHYIDRSNKVDQVSRPTNHLFEREGSIRAFVTGKRTLSLDRAVMFGSSSSWFHFLIEVLPRFQEINSKDMRQTHLLVRGDLPGTIREVLSRFQFKSQISLHDGEVVHVEDLLTVTDLRYPDATNLLLRTDEVKWVRDFIRKGLTFPRGPDLVYLERDESLFRRLKNRNELSLLLRNLGFKVLNPENLTLEEQVFYFNSAKIVVAESGAALTNIIFMNSGASVVEIHPGNAQAGLWGSLGKIFGVTVKEVYGRPLRIRNFLANDSSFKVDIKKIESAVNSFKTEINSG